MKHGDAEPDEMACQGSSRVITDYLEGTLGADDTHGFEAHVAECPPCRVYIDQIRHARRAVGRLSTADLDPSTRTQLVEAFRAWTSAAAD
jgi:anti-sigma factor RsiW